MFSTDCLIRLLSATRALQLQQPLSGVTYCAKPVHPISPFDKASASTRILLHDTQAHLEKFTERVTHLTTSLDDAKRELVLVQKLYQDDHERVVDRMIGLVNRCQTSLQKDIGTPAQSADVREVSQNLVNLSNRLESLDKKIDALNMLNQTQSQALQTMQDQQGQMLTALIPILPLLQVIPCHIDNARSQLKESVLELRQEIISRESMPAGPRAVLRKTPRPPASVMSGGSLCTPSDRKKRRLEAASDVSGSILPTKLTRCTTALHDTLQVPADPPLAEPGSSATSPPGQSPAMLASRAPVETARCLTAHESLGFQQNQVVSPSAAGTLPIMAPLFSPQAVAASRLVAAVFQAPYTPERGAYDNSNVHATPAVIPAEASSTTPLGQSCSSLNYMSCPEQMHVSSTAHPLSDDHGRSSNHELASASPVFQDPTSTTPVHRASRTPLKHPSHILRSYTHKSGMVAAAAKQVAGGTIGAWLNAPSDSIIDDTGVDLRNGGKPMSLKARRALVEDSQHKEGKRFIPLDDEEDENGDFMI